jgi:transcriptional regulator with PAS, ATPase and Fis domain
MRETLQSARMASRTDSTVLLTGESGSGKDHLAVYIHDHSSRSGGPFFSVNCAAVSPELAESELFGHEAGAFTGARGRKRGLLELAEGGTLLLNEVGELSLGLQAKLLTFLDTRSMTRVGGEKEITVNARLIAATNRNLEQEVAEGRFRADLYYRLNVFSIRVPPLRERLEDLSRLVEEIISQLAAEQQLVSNPRIASHTIEKLRRYDWPGNVRELRNVLERALIISGGGTLVLPPLRQEEIPEKKTPDAFFIPQDKTFNEIVTELKVRLVRDALQRCGGNRSQAAKMLDVSRGSIINYIKELE